MEFNLKGMQLTELTENEMREIDGGKKGWFKRFWKNSGLGEFLAVVGACAIIGSVLP